MRTSKSILAGVAAGALAAGMITGVFGATSVSAAVTVVSPTMPTASRAGTATSITGTATATLATDVLCVAATTTPSGITFAPAKYEFTAAASESITLTTTAASVGAPGNYALAYYASDDTAVAANAGNCPALTTQPILATSTLVVGGAVAAATIAPASQSAGVASAATYAVSATDSSGRPTLFGAANATTGYTFGADSYTLSSNSTTTTFNGASATTVVGDTGATFTAQNSVSGTAAITLTPSNGAVGTASASLSTVTAGTANGVAVIAPESPSAAPGPYAVPVGTTAVTFAITGTSAQIGKQFVYSVSGTGATAASNQLTPAATTAPDGSAVTTVTIPVTDSTSGKTVIVTPAGVTAATATMTTRALDAATPGTIVAKPGTTVTVSGVVTDQFGDPVPSAAVTGSVTGSNTTATTNGLTNASGEYSVTYSASALSSANDTVALTITQGAYTSSPLAHNVTVKFNAAGVADMSTLTFGSGNVAAADILSTPAVAYDGTANTNVNGSSAASIGDVISVTGTADVTGVLVTYTTTDGFLSTSASTAWNEGKKSVSATSGTAVYLFSTKTGSISVSASAGGTALDGKVTFISPPDAARDIELSASPASTPKETSSSITLTVKDVFGNAGSLGTATHGGSNSSVTLETDKGTLAGGVSIYTISATNSAGRATVSLTATTEGIAKVSGLGSGGQFGNAAGNPSGSSAPVKSASVDVEFTGSAGKSITIAGARTTVKGKPGIEIDGVTTGIENGKTVIPYFRFPGQTSYSQGSARPVVQDDAFSWQRKTGKKFYAYVTNDDGAVQSNRVIIQAK